MPQSPILSQEADNQSAQVRQKAAPVPKAAPESNLDAMKAEWEQVREQQIQMIREKEEQLEKIKEDLFQKMKVMEQPANPVPAVSGKATSVSAEQIKIQAALLEKKATDLTRREQALAEEEARLAQKSDALNGRLQGAEQKAAIIPAVQPVAAEGVTKDPKSAEEVKFQQQALQREREKFFREMTRQKALLEEKAKQLQEERNRFEQEKAGQERPPVR